ncbi:nucleotide disphospho-sugar-binding domain-containing protein [Actinoplanes xinjiangensis]|uniref:MGT family glycosyltransferase n=1 Tax=Actinoplanes xinjiangensis TaxID=512350 RepID=A0A316FF33_9ACTN|nr:nucleotide disphospho-sugar-binding domain-containing protein [Actinoplanes xinjiangensis]PWK46735.1 MGT family glycosyltransferase [Actinoplanes xinjiangensis]GIF40443.1 putative UDP-glucosyltransferase YjiC [Actinoplanes xinjiangensis]
MRSHIALMSVPLHAHITPVLGVAAELVARGHRVTFASGGAFASLIAETGATPVTYLSTFPADGAPGEGWLAPAVDGRQTARRFGRERDAAFPQIVAAYGADRPDLIVHDTATAFAPPLADLWGVPRVRFSPAQVFLSAEDDPLVPSVVALPRSLQVNVDQVGPEHHFVGPVPWHRRAGTTWTAPNSRRVALVSLGTTHHGRTDVPARCAEGLAAAGWHVVIVTDGPLDLGEPAGSVEVHHGVAPAPVLEKAEVVVTAGGAGDALDGLAHGVPLVVVPQGVEQFLTAARIQALGVGRTITPERFSAAAVRAAAEELTGDAATRTALDTMRAEILLSGGAPAAADVIEKQLARGDTA